MIRNISTKDALYVHEYLADYYEDSDDPIYPRGIKDIGLFESALSRPFATAGGVDLYLKERDKAAALFHGVISNHCFHNGNKRTALLLTLCFLGSRGYWVDKCTDEELFDFTLKTAAHNITENRANEMKVIKDFFKKNARKIRNQDRPLSLIDLTHLLANAGFELQQNNDCFNVINKERGEFVTGIRRKGYSGMEQYDIPYIKKLRKKLGLTATNGWDSIRFYMNGHNLTDNIGDLLKLRGAVMDSLAKI